MTELNITFTKPIKKIGSSYWVLIPNNIITFLKLKQGDILTFKIIPKEE